MLQLQTLQDWLDWVYQQFDAADLYYGHGTDNAWDEAVQLVLYAAQLPADSGEEVLGQPINDRCAELITNLVRQRVEEHKPLPYLTHQAWFMQLPFYVDERVLIPRSPFAEWIANQFQPWIKPDEVTRILEIGTGSGCMAIAAALAFPDAQVDAVDISADSLAVATVNVQHYQLEQRVRLIESDCFAGVAEQHYDVIMSNPPYVGDAEMQTLPDEYRHEPDSALRAKEQGLAIVARILDEAADHLNAHGILMVEVGNSDELLQETYPNVPFVWLEQESGGHGLFVLTREQLQQHFG